MAQVMPAEQLVCCNVALDRHYHHSSHLMISANCVFPLRAMQVVGQRMIQILVHAGMLTA
jgi:hypothetical protein